MARDDDLHEERAEQARGLAGLAHALTADGGPLVEATLVDLVREWRRVRELGTVTRWCRDRLVRHSLDIAPDPLPPAPEPLDVVRSLPPLPRAALVLELVDGLDAVAVGQALGVSRTKAQAALAEARTLVGERLPEPDADPPPAPVTVPQDRPPLAPDLFAPPWSRR